MVVSVSSTPSGARQLDQPLDVAAHERLAAGEAQLLHPERDCVARDPLDLLERQQLGAARNWKSAPNTYFGMQ